jgi:acyl carrier protein
MALTRTSLTEFLADTLGVDAAEIDEATPLFSSGLIDSEDMVELVFFIEGEEDFQFAPDEISLDHLDSVGHILKFVEARRGG